MQRTAQWRLTPPTHVVAAFRVTLDQFKFEGGTAARGARNRRSCETFRVGCIGAIDANEMRNVVSAVAETLKDMGVKQFAPSLKAAA